jgi:hypothetical protein
LKKNTATKWIVFAFDRTNNTPKTGDAANITANVRIDGGGVNAVDDTNPAELEDGYYIFDITAAECNGDLIVICPASSTADIQVIGVPGAVWTDTLSAEIAVVDGIVDDILVDTAVIGALGAGLTAITDKTNNLPTDPADESLIIAATDALAVLINDVPTVGEIADAVWDEAISGHAGVGSTGEALSDAGAAGSPPTVSEIADAVWDELTAGHQTADTTGKALTDAGSLGTPLDAAGVRAAIGMASADLDAQLDGVAKTAQLTAISGGLTINSYPTSSTVDQGAETGTVAALTADDDSHYVVTDEGTGIDFILLFSPYDEHAAPSTLHMHGYYDEDIGSTNSCVISAYNFELSAEQATDVWDILHVLTNQAADQAHDLPLAGAHRAPDAGTFAAVACGKGDVLIRFEQTDIETGSDVFLDHVSVGFAGHSITLEEIEASTVLAKTSDVQTITADIVDLIWDEPLVGHVTPDTAGAVLQIANDASPATPAEIAAEVWAKVVTGAISAETALATLYNGWTSAGAGSGAGAVVSVITVNVGASPEDGVEVWASTDIEGTNVVAGTLITDAFGQVTFMLDEGTYFLWKQKAGVNFTNPEEIVVTAP